MSEKGVVSWVIWARGVKIDLLGFNSESTVRHLACPCPSAVAGDLQLINSYDGIQDWHPSRFLALARYRRYSP